MLYYLALTARKVRAATEDEKNNTSPEGRKVRIHMRATINGKRYNTARCETLGERDHYNWSNTYSGTTYLLRASDGELLVWTDANGQDLYCWDELGLFEGSNWSIDDFAMNEDQEARCVELGLIEEV